MYVVYLITCMSIYLFVYLMEQMSLAIYMQVFLIRKWKNCLEVPGFLAHVEGGTRKQLLDS